MLKKTMEATHLDKPVKMDKRVNHYKAKRAKRVKRLQAAGYSKAQAQLLDVAAHSEGLREKKQSRRKRGRDPLIAIREAMELQIVQAERRVLKLRVALQALSLKAGLPSLRVMQRRSSPRFKKG